MKDWEVLVMPGKRKKNIEKELLSGRLTASSGETFSIGGGESGCAALVVFLGAGSGFLGAGSDFLLGLDLIFVAFGN